MVSKVVSKDMAANLSLIDKLPKVSGTYRVNVDLSKINWFNVGGPAEVVFRPSDIADLCKFIKEKPKHIPLTILGVGSNLLVRDGGIKGVVLRLGRGFTDITEEQPGKLISCGAGALSFNAAVASIKFGISGLEFLSGVPGTIGGALAMNAGAYGSDVASVLEYAEAVDEFGQLHKLSLSDIGYVYRGNTLPEGMIFVRGVFRGVKAEPRDIKDKIDEITQQRESSQPVRARTSGSTFKNPMGHKAWQLIDAAGLRGYKLGGAMVSEKHCNFFINTGNATAADIENLGEYVRKRVFEQSGIMLEWEVRVIGNR